MPNGRAQQMFNRNCLKLCFVVSLFSQGTFAGWGDSGGGEWVLDAHNPWFVKNTESVLYCMQVSKDEVSLPEAEVQELFERAVNFWKRDFANLDSSVGIARQNFKSVGPCNGSIDLEIRFGKKALSKEQLEHFTSNGENPDRYIGVSVQTHYDRVKLKGKGFIFVNGDTYEGNGGMRRVPKKIWSEKGLLYRLFIHELGHVFGFSHAAEGIMSATYPERMIRDFQRGQRELADLVDPNKIMSSPTEFKLCALKDMALYFFLSGIEESNNRSCVSIDLTKKVQTLEFKMENGDIVSGELIVKYRAKETQFTYPIKLFLTGEQKVFPNMRGEAWLNGPAMEASNINYKFVTAKDTKSFLIKMNGSALEAYGLIQPAEIIWRIK